MLQQPDDEFANLPISNSAKWARRNKDKVRAMRRAYYKTPAGKESQRKANKRYKDKQKARVSIDNNNK